MARAGQEPARDFIRIRCERGADIARGLGFPEQTALATACDAAMEASRQASHALQPATGQGPEPGPNTQSVQPMPLPGMAGTPAGKSEP